jgi:hypothetical protein
VILPRTGDYRSKARYRSKVVAAIAAHDFAESIGSPLNLSLDAHWQWTRFANRNRRDAVAELLERQRHWLARHGIGFYSIVVRENPPPANNGEHAHELVHVPSKFHAAFSQNTRNFPRGNKQHRKRALVCTPTWHSRGELAYMLKGSTPPARALLDQFNVAGKRRSELDPHQGIIYGKRLLISQRLDTKARSGLDAPNGKPRTRRFSPKDSHATAHADYLSRKAASHSSKKGSEP